MAALSADKSVTELDSPIAAEHYEKMSASTTIYKGSLVVINGGYLEPATTATGLIGAGVAQEQIDNSSGSDGDESCKFRSGIFPFEKDGSDTPTQADVGAGAYAVDDQTIANTDGTSTRSEVGKIYAVDSDYVWVAITYPPVP